MKITGTLSGINRLLQQGRLIGRSDVAPIFMAKEHPTSVYLVVRFTLNEYRPEFQRYVSHQALLLSLINGPNAGAKAQAAGERTVDVKVPGVRKRLSIRFHPSTEHV